MTRSKFLTVSAAASALALGAGVAAAAEPTTAQLMEQIQQLQAKVQQLETNQSQALSAKDVDATLERVLADADRRSQLLQMEGFTAGYNKGKFVIQDAAGNWTLNPYFQFQFRGVSTFFEERTIFDDGDAVGVDDNEDHESGFEVRRMKFGFKGNAFSPEFTYNFKWEADQDGGAITLEDAWVQYAFSDQFSLRAGQWKENVFHEETVSSSKQLAVDRSMVNELLGGGQTDYVQGIALAFMPADQFRGEVALIDGLDTDNTDFFDRQGGSFGVAPDWGVTGRIEYLAMGDWKAYEDFSAMGNTDDLLVIGAGFDYSQEGGFDAIFHGVDVQYENAGGLGLYAGFYGVSSDFNDGGDFYDWGAIAQAGYMINEQWEVFGRYGYTSLDEDSVAAGTEDTYNELTAGVNWYVGGGHNAKITVDATYLFDGAPTDIGGIGVVESQDSELIVRGQFQLLL